MQTADDGGRRMKKIKFGIIGCGLMGKEFASAAGRWMHVNERVAQPEIVAVCDPNAEAMEWFRTRVDSVKYFFQDYTELLRCGEVEAVYCAVPHHLHKQVYVDIIDAKKHFLGEKPFGIDREANDAILAAARRNPEVVVRCASEFPYYPAAQKLIRWIEEDNYRGQRGAQPFQRPGPEKADQLEAADRDKRGVRLHGGPRDPHGAHSLPDGLETAQRMRGAPEHREGAPGRERQYRPLRDVGQCDAFVRNAGKKRECFPHEAGDEADEARRDKRLVP